MVYKCVLLLFINVCECLCEDLFMYVLFEDKCRYSFILR